METLTLAPASGAGIGKILADKLLANDDFIPSLESAMLGGLKATRSFWTKDAGLVTEPDFRVQVQTAALLLAHMEGEPVKRIIHQHLGGEGKIDVLSALQESPALLEAAAKMVEKANFRKSGRTKKAEPVVEGDAGPSVQ